MTMSSRHPFGHAVVIGGSVGGLAVAQVLTEFFERVTVIERDAVPAGPEFRKGAPQGRHPHALFLKGLNALESLFPGLTRELKERGAVSMNMGTEFEWNIFSQWREPHFKSALDGLAASRPLIEHAIRGRVAGHPQVTVRNEGEVIGLMADAARARATGVRVRERGTQTESVIDADLVVDASGRDSNAPDWLGQLGFPAPIEQTVTANPGYSTRIYEALPDTPWKLMYVMPAAPDSSRGVVIMPIEGNRWMVSLIGMNGDYPPTDETGFMDFLRSLPTPRPYEALARARPLCAPYGFRRGDNRLRRYDQLARFMEGFVAFGDAVYALNPVYGQGMTVAASGAVMLREMLRRWSPGRSLVGLPREFQKALLKVVQPAWMLATGEDRRWGGAKGLAGIDPITRQMQAYIGRVMRVMMTDQVVAEAFFHVQQMLRGPLSLLAPRIFLRVMRNPASAPTAILPAAISPAPAR